MEGSVQLQALLRSKRNAIVNRWTDLTLEVYPSQSAQLMRREKDRFQNPVGRVTRESLESLYDGLVAGRSAEKMAPELDGIVRIRAVQDLSPSAAVGFTLLLKRAVREELGENGSAAGSSAERIGLYAAIDRLALQAFDQFVRCREKIYQLRLREVKQYGPAECGPCDDLKGGCGA